MPRPVTKWEPCGGTGPSASHQAKAKTEPEVKVEVVDGRRVPTPAERTLTRDDLRKWGNSMAAMPAERVMATWILARQRTAAAPDQPTVVEGPH